MNGLEMGTAKTLSRPLQLTIADWSELQDCLQKHFDQDSRVIVYLHYKVLIGKLTKDGLKFYKDETFEPKFLVKMRAFNEHQELLLWRESEGKFSARLRIDGEGDEEKHYIEAQQLLWGKAQEVDDGWILLTEARGTKICLPYRFKDQANKVIKIKTRNYIDYNELGQAGYVDCRFVCFCEGRY